MIKSEIKIKVILDELKKDILRYQKLYSYGQMPAYLVMNEATREAIVQANLFDITLDSSNLPMFYGISILINNNLPNNVVEIVG